jgi:hypothetical protein
MAIKTPHAVKPANSEQRAAASISGAASPSPPSAPEPVVDQETGKTTVNMRFDAALLKRIDRAAKARGISRTAWLHMAAYNALE